MNKYTIGFDFDGTIADENGNIIITPQQGSVIITGNTEDKEKELRDILSKVGMGNMPIFFFPDKEILKKNVDKIDQLVGEFKAQTIKELGIKQFYEDSQIQAEIIQKENPDVEIILISSDHFQSKKQIKRMVIFTLFGEESPIAEKAMAEGIEVVLAQIEDLEDTSLPEEGKKSENKDKKKRRLENFKGIVPILPAKQVVKNLSKLSEEEKKETFILCGMNYAWRYAAEIKKLGISGHYPTEEDRRLEVDREKGKEFVRKHYDKIEVGEYQKFSKIKEGEDFLKDTEDAWVLKSNTDGPTIVPQKKDIEKSKIQILDTLKQYQKEYEKSGFIMEKFIFDAVELTPQCLFFDGKPIYYSLDIELKHKGAGETDAQSGCASNLIIPLTEEDPIFKYSFPKEIYDMAAKRKNELFIWDISILIDTKENGELMMGEFCSDRFGFDTAYTEICMAGGVKNYFESIINGRNPIPPDTFGFAVRLFNPYPDDELPAMSKSGIGIGIDEEVMPYVWIMDAKKEKDKLVTAGYSEDMLIVTETGKTIQEAIDKVYKIIAENVSFSDVAYRSKEDILSTNYPSSIKNRYRYAVDNNLILEKELSNNEEEIETLVPQIISQPNENNGKINFIVDVEPIRKEISGLKNLLNKMPKHNILFDTEPIRKEISELKNLKPQLPVINNSIDTEPIRQEISSIKQVINDNSNNSSLDNFLIKFTDMFSSLHKKIGSLEEKFSNSSIVEAINNSSQNTVEHLSKIVDRIGEKSENKDVIIAGGGSPSSMQIRGYQIKGTGRKTSATPGTAVQLVSSSTICRRVDISGLPANKGFVFIGDLNVSAVSGSEKGSPLGPLNTATLSVTDLNSIWIDIQAGNSGDGVSFTFYD